MLSKIIANYFLSTIVADHTASAIFLSTASPLYFPTRPCDLIASILELICNQV